MGRIILAVLLGIFISSSSIMAAPDIGLDYASNLELVGVTEDPRDILVGAVRFLLTWLGILAVSVILWGGLRWMISMGNEDRLAAAKATITSGIIGLILILSSFAIVNFVIQATGDVLSDGIII